MLTFLWGACIGSYANVCIHRIPIRASTVFPRSHCPSCRQRIAWYDNIPLLSWCALNARCRKCFCGISFRYLLVELITAVCFLLVWRHFGFDPRTMVYWGLITALIIGAFIDFDAMIIPDRITLGGIIAGLVLSVLIPSLHAQRTAFNGFIMSAIGLVTGTFWLWLVAKFGAWFFQREAMGMGDIKLLGATGAFLGWQSVIFTVLVSSVLGAAVGLSLVLTGKKQMQSRIPYGPYLALAAIIWILGGYKIWNLFMGYGLISQNPGLLPANL